MTADKTPITVTEPDLALDKSFAAGSYEAGDTIEYTITINHSGSSTAAAYDLTVEDLIPEGMSYVNGSMTTSFDSLSITANDSGPNLSWTIEELAQAYDSSTPLELTYQVTIDDSVEPAEVLTNTAEISWTSHPDDTNPDQRTGTAGDSLNDYIQTTDTDLTINDDLSIAKSITSTGTEYAVGDTVIYQVNIDLIKGTINGLSVDNLIPGGLKGLSSDSFTLKDGEGNVLTKADYLTDQDLSDNNLVFDQIVNSAADGIAGDKITIEYDVIVENIADNQNGDTKEITTDLYYDDAAGNQQNVTADKTPITVTEPDLALDKSFAAGSYEAGDTIEYTITINHSGSSTAAAYDLTVEDLIPEGMSYVNGSMTTSFDSLSITANDSGPNLSWTIEELAQAYDSSTPLELTYQVTIDADVRGSIELENQFGVNWYSQSGNVDEQREYSQSSSVILTTIPDLTVNDQLTNNNTPTISGTTNPEQAGNIVKVVVDGIEYQPVVDGNGDWEFDIPAGNELAEGDYTVEAEITDKAGNTTTAEGSLEVDLTEPEIDLDNDNIVTNNQTPIIGGTSNQPENSDVEVVLTDEDGNEVFSGIIQTDTDGNWSIDSSTEGSFSGGIVELAEGNYTVKATTEDKAGNTAETTGALEVDITPPELTVNDQVTNDTTPTITGSTDEPDESQVTVTVDGNEYTTTVEDGGWSVDIPAGNELAEGDYTVEAEITDKAGNTTTAEGSLEVDLTEPEIDLDNDNIVTNNQTPIIGGTSNQPENSDVEVVLTDEDGNEVFSGIIQTDTDGNWSIDSSTEGSFSGGIVELAEGNYTVKATTEDKAGNTAETTGALEVDITPPELTVNDQVTNDTTPTITGSTDEPDESQVTVTVDGNEYTTTVEDGGWSVDIPAGNELAEGDYTVEAEITDKAGNTTTAEGSLEVDLTEPEIDLDNDNIVTNNQTPIIGGTSNQPENSDVEVVLTDEDGNEVFSGIIQTDTDGNWSIDSSTEGSFSGGIVELAEGNYTVKATTEDKAGNTAETTGALEVDITPPELTVNDQVTNDTTPTITGSTDEPDESQVTVTVDGNEYTTTVEDGGWSVDIPAGNELAEGDYTVEAEITDKAGNTTTAEGSLEVDLTEPEIDLDNDNIVTNNQTPIIGGTSNQPENSDVEVVLTDEDGNEVFRGTTQTDTDGNWSIDSSTEGSFSGGIVELAEGNYTVKATTEDEAGNKAETTGALEVDITPPELTVDDQATNDTTPIITGSTDEPAGSTVDVVVRDDEGNLIFKGEVLVEEDGSWSINTEEEGNWSEGYDQFPEGDYSVEAEITDDAGNTTNAAGDLKIDLTEPEIEVIDNQTNSNTPTIKGKTDEPAGSIVDVVIRDKDGNVVFEGETTVNEDGNWSINVDQPLDLGEYEVEASITDDAGNTSTATGVLEVYPTDIIINKTAAEKQVSIGDFISYKIEIINETDFDLDSFTLYDKLPAGFRFVKDSAVIVSETGSETKLKTEGNRLVSWEGLELNAESSMEIRYTLVVGSGVVNSNTYINQAYAKVGENLISNTAEAEVLVIEDPLFTTSTVIGKVYLDQNEDRMQTEGEAEKGLEGIRIISTTGQIVETDQFGRFHFEIRAEGNIQPMQTLVLKLDKNSLPAGAEILSKNPVIVKIREGLMFEVNFRIK
ncbi:Ig-like domain-containing protein [Halanaerobium congolense]|uniref:Ig-like domain-containing protein n=1 Tax=Halanaerobium congolense TaxID=54121 RepID=UPI000D3B33BC|nr:Ig-like domain-containing protein [Halanaerobium congolense]